MTFKTGTRLGIGAATVLLIAALGAQTAVAQTANKHQVKRHAHQQRHQRHHPRPDLDLRLDVSPVVAATGSQVTYTATVTNHSRRSSRGAGFLNRIPGQTSFVSASASQGSCSGSTLVYCNLGALAPRTSATVTVVVTVNHAGRIDDAGWVSNNPPRHWRHERHATSWVRDVSPDLGLRLTGSPGAVDSGQQVTYTATITNRGSGAAATAAFQDVIPGGTTFVSAAASQGSCSGNQTVLCNLGALNPGAGATVTIVVATTQGGHITDRGWVSTNPPNDWQHQRSVTTYVRNVSPALDFHLVGSPSAVSTGQQVTYTATIGNHGSGAAANAAFQDLISPKTTLASVNPSQGTCSGNPTIVCNLGSLAPGATATVTIVVTTSQSGYATDRGWISTNPPGDWRHERDVTTAVRDLQADLDFHLIGSPSSVNAGQQVTYTATVGNHGPGTASNAGFQDVLPGKVDLVSITPSQGTCSGNPTIVCNLGSLATGATATVTIVVMTTQPGSIIDRGWVSTSPPGGWRHERDAVTDVKPVPPTTTTASTTTTTTTTSK
jgi:uncharacterized repeat protein (TIGR01451 family)